MEIIRDDEKLKRLARITQLTSALGLGALMIGMFISFQGNPQLQLFQWVALLIGIVCWQLGLNMGYRYTRTPRPDESLDIALKAAAPRSTLYHYMLPARHVLLTRSGPILFIPLINSGLVTVGGDEGDRWRWKAPIWKRIMGSEPRLGNPTQEAELELAKLVQFIEEHAPEIDEIPIGAVIVFTNPLAKLDVDASRIPALYAGDLKKFVRKNTGRALPQAQYETLKAVFDQLDSVDPADPIDDDTDT